MNNVLENLKKSFDILSVEYPIAQQMAIEVKVEQAHSVLSYLKSDGYRQLSIISAIDWIKDNQFELVFIVHNWDTGIHILVSIKLDRDNPRFSTITNIYPGAQYYERDVHENFGIEFHGNEMSFKQLFLEMWDDMPPMRKDFDPLAYSKKKFPEREYNMKFKPRVGGEE